MEVLLGIIAVLAAGLIAWATPGVIQQRRIDKAMKHWERAVEQISYSMAQFSFALAGTGAAMQEFVAVIEEVGYSVEDTHSDR